MLAIAAISVHQASAQSQTSAGPSNNCGNVIANFNAGNQGYTSNSIYGTPRSDSSFYYNNRRGFWTEVGEDSRERTLPPNVPPAAGRMVPILSTDYPSPTTAGFFDVGFVYVVPNPAVDQFNIALIRLTTTSTAGGDQTKDDIVAISGFKSFSSFSTIAPTPYTDQFGNPALTGQRGAICIRLSDVDITTGSNIRYRVEVTYNILSAGTFTVFDDFSLSNTVNIPLPVSFMGITAKKTDNVANIRWDIADEKNVLEYQIERSTNGSTFTKAGSVSATGRSVYEFTDPSSQAGTVYYRIRSVDIDGKTKLSSIIKLSAGSLNSFANKLKLYPTPATDDVTIEHKQLDANAKITLNSIDGKVIKVIVPTRGASHTPVNLSDIRSGLYIIRVFDGKGQTESIKLVKQ